MATTSKSASLAKTTLDVGDNRKGLAGPMAINHIAQTGDPVGNITQSTVVKTETADPLRTVDGMNGNTYRQISDYDRGHGTRDSDT